MKNFFVNHKVLSVIIVLILIGAIGSALRKDDAKNTSSAVNSPTSAPDSADTSDADPTAKPEATQPPAAATQPPTATPVPADDFADVPTEYTLSNGHYTAGIDLPIGRCNIEAVEGQGNVSSSNIFDGGINEMFGVDDGTGFYTSSFNGLKMKDGVVLSIGGGVVVKLVYKDISGRPTGREYDKASAFELSNGNYVSGADFPAGIYKLEATEGSGNISSSNMLDGGINEMFGVDDGSGFYTSTFENIELKENVELSISGGVVVKLTPAK